MVELTTLILPGVSKLHAKKVAERLYLELGVLAWLVDDASHEEMENWYARHKDGLNK